MTVHNKVAFDITQPPPGQRLQLGSIAAELGITIKQISDDTGLSRAAVSRLFNNEFPARLDQAALRQRVAQMFEEHGASAEQLESLFHSQVTARRRRVSLALAGVDKYGRRTAPATPTTATPEEPDMLLSRQTLTTEAKRHFKMLVNPFAGEVETAGQLFDGGDVRYVREAVWQCARTSGFVAVVGESGAGKTTIFGDLEARMLEEPQGVVLIKPGVLGLEQSNAKGQIIKAADILHAIITTLSPNATMPMTTQARTVRAEKLLEASHQVGNTHLLVIEEAHSLPDATLTHLKRLHELRVGRRSLLGILLLGQPELKLRLADGLRSGSLREVSQRCELVELLPLDSDLGGYLACRLSAHNHKVADVIDADAVNALRARMTRKTSSGAVSMCYPLAVNNMMTKALNIAAGLGVPTVTKDVIATL